MSSIKLTNSLLIVTATKVEAQAVLEIFSKASDKAWTRQVIKSKTYYSLGIHGGVPVFMVQSEVGTATPSGSVLTIHQAILDLDPQAVIMCGIAFGLRPDRQQLGDILVARQILYYGSQKVDLQRGQIPRGDRTTASERLLDRFRSGDIDWQGVQTHFGLVLSDERLVNDPDLIDLFLKTEPEAIGGDMEGAGLYSAAHKTKVDWILVKAICDWADGSKNSDVQLLAAHNAAEFVLYVLQLGGWESSEQNKRSDPNLDGVFREPNSGKVTAQCRSTEQLPSSKKEIPISTPQNIPYGIDNFVGRYDDFARLHQLLQTSTPTAIVVIQGMGGVGKTELATQYASLYSPLQTYSGGICWLESRTEEIGNQIIQFVENNFGLTPPENRSLQNQVEFCWDRWPGDGAVLVVLDDVSDYLKVEPYLPPQASRFKILITTRLQLEFPQLNIDVLKEDTALNLLRGWIGKEPVYRELADARKLCQWLGYLPLGLQLAGRYIKAYNLSSLEEMQHCLEEKGLKHDSLRQKEKYPAWTLAAQRGVAAAFDLSWEELSEEAKQLGCLLSLFALAPIPWQLVEKAAAKQELEALEDARLELESMHLLQGDKTCQLHQPIQKFFHEKLEDELTDGDALRQFLTIAMMEEARKIPDTQSIREHFESFLLSKPHIEKTTEIAPRFLHDENIYWLFIGLSRLCDAQGLYDQVDYWCSQGLSVGETNLSSGSSPVADRMRAILWLLQGKVLRIKSKYELALNNYRKSINILQNQDDLMVRALRGQGHVYRLLGKHKNSIQSYEKSRLLAKSLRDSKDEARAAYGVARIYRLRGDLKNAELRYQEAGAAYKQLGLPIENAWALFGLAEVQRMKWNIKQSAETYSAALKQYEQLSYKEGEAYAKWGTGEINRLFAAAEAEKGKLTIAENYFDKAKTDYQCSLELCLENGDTRSEAWALLGLAEVARMEGKYTAASRSKTVIMYQHALGQYQQAYTKVHVKECVEEAHALLGIAATKRLLMPAEAADDAGITIEKAYADALEIYQNRNMNYCEVYVLVDKALYCLGKSSHKQAESCLAQAEEICTNNGYEREKNLIEKIRTESDSSELHTLNFP